MVVRHIPGFILYFCFVLRPTDSCSKYYLNRWVFLKCWPALDFLDSCCPSVAQWGSGSCPWRMHCSYFLIVLQLVHARSSWPFIWACDSAFQRYSTNPFSLDSGRPKTQGHSSGGRILSNHLPLQDLLAHLLQTGQQMQFAWPDQHTWASSSFLLAERLSFLAPLLQSKQTFCW